MTEKCFACGRKLGKQPNIADTRDHQIVLVGSECFKLVKAAGEIGYQPPRGGPRLWLVDRSKRNTDPELDWALDTLALAYGYEA